MIANTTDSLSQHDKLVLDALFDNETFNKTAISINTINRLPGISATQLSSLQARELSAIQPLNAPNPDNAQIGKAISELTALITEAPHYASVWNNRAQAVRMLVGDDLTRPAVVESTLYHDLCQACQLAAPSSPYADISVLQAGILAAAHTHRGLLLYKCSKMTEESRKSLPRELRGADGVMLESMAGRDFQMGSKYGNPVAKQMAVRLNPYAKMCGEIVKEAMIKDLKESMALGMMTGQIQ